MTTNAETRYEGDGSTTDFAIVFGSNADASYTKAADVKVYVNTTLTASRPYTANQTQGTEYLISDDGTKIEFQTGYIPAANSGTDNILIFRETDRTVLPVQPTDSASLTGAQFTTLVQWAMFYAEEVEDTI